MKQILGIDVGGTKIASALVDENLKLDQLKVIPTSQTNLIHQLIELIASYQNFEAIGLAMPGPVSANGLVKRLPNVENFEPLNLKEALAKFNLPVEVINDAKAFTLAEATIGEGKSYDSVAGIVLGTGTGVGFVINKKVYNGKDGLAGEFDHIVLPEGRLLREYVKSARPFKTVNEAENYLRSLISIVVLSFNPELIVLSGGWSNLTGMENLVNELAVNVGGFENKTPIKISKLEYPSLLGAALLAYNNSTGM